MLEYVAEDRTRAVIGMFRLAGSTEATYRLYTRGLGPGRRYSITLDNDARAINGTTTKENVILTSRNANRYKEAR